MIRGRRRRTTTSAQISTAPPPDLVDRCFDARGPNRLWVANLTYVRTWSGWAYVAFVLDVYSRMIVGWQLASHMRTELVLDALEQALWAHGVRSGTGLIHHLRPRVAVSVAALQRTPGTGRQQTREVSPHPSSRAHPKLRQAHHRGPGLLVARPGRQRDPQRRRASAPH
ncbi:DDE-type integrase/transposase/recombinase [Allosalinactinospora lopnorensis]|uniref:DDE-type integrase/transposase/recombinase n=1 Tax=Allosalinactinospora lopnorensis TaxID=1352348 RepID=UPI000A4F65EE|nr:DDE-type integrase/transposase/recombinase [Allosalinactinospora lopnorensis]